MNCFSLYAPHCAILENSAYFGKCADHVDVDVYVQMCRFDACQLYLDGTLKNEYSMCQVLDMYVQQCQNLAPKDERSTIVNPAWRDDATLDGLCSQF